MTVYIDVIFLENIAINFLILAVTGYVSRFKASSVKLLIGSFIGAMYVLVGFLPDMEVYFSITAKVLISFVMVAVTFWPEKIKDFIKLTLFFYLVSFVFGGAVVGLYYLINPKGGMVSNGIYNISGFPIKTLLVSIIFAYIVIKICWDIIKSKAIHENLMVSVSIEFEHKKVMIDALIDTGNSLRDPISNIPVIVVEFEAVKDILPEEVKSIFINEEETNLDFVVEEISKTGWASRFRLIPFNSLGKINGMLIGFRPDRVEVKLKDERKNFDEIVIGIYNRLLSGDESYKALLSLELVS
ncbi:MAG: sigma-E processing peptidase SpoIIGA [Deltaproteobacteria bacterium]